MASTLECVTIAAQLAILAPEGFFGHRHDYSAEQSAKLTEEFRRNIIIKRLGRGQTIEGPCYTVFEPRLQPYVIFMEHDGQCVSYVNGKVRDIYMLQFEVAAKINNQPPGECP